MKIDVSPTDYLKAMHETCMQMPGYLQLKENAPAYSKLMKLAGPELEAAIDAYCDIVALEGFANGFAWAQSVADECIQLRNWKNDEAK